MARPRENRIPYESQYMMGIDCLCRLKKLLHRLFLFLPFRSLLLIWQIQYVQRPALSMSIM